jgi:hypothetical protein
MKRRWPAIVTVSAVVAECVAGGRGVFAVQGAIPAAGSWGRALEVPGLAALNKGGEDTRVPVVSCAPAGTCTAGGYYTDRSGHAPGPPDEAMKPPAWPLPVTARPPRGGRRRRMW